MVLAYVGLGANLDEPIVRLRAGLDALARLPQTRLVSYSSFYRSAPLGVTEQPDFVNAVCALETTLPAAALLQGLLDIEREQGRTRTTPRGGPRTLDLDLLLYGFERLQTERLTLPHPRMHERGFVLAPLTEIDPAIEIPDRGSAMVLLQTCRGQRVERLES